jgi:uncharacterized membrane protein YphA (DoxX/SURF4 family)
MAAVAESIPAASAGKWLNVGLWAAQILLGLAFCLFGFMKLTSPIGELSQNMLWTGQLPVEFVRTVGVIDILGGVGVILPAATRILPWLTVWAALGCTVLQVFAICFHSYRGEFQVLPLNFILLPLAAFILWGRSRKVPLESRRRKKALLF